ncbi:MAG: LamG domain-containing protein, partial [Verrucomicrobiaceae bacterium]
MLLARAATFIFLSGGVLGSEVALLPYEVDPFTLHLWHLDEGGPPFRNSVINGDSLRGLHNGARAGEAGLPEMGRAISFNHHAGGEPGTHSYSGGIVTLAPGLASGPEDNAPKGFRFQGDNGAFTFEAVLKFDRLPAAAPSVALGIVTMDGETKERAFSFRIEKEGFLSFSPLEDSGASGGAIASIPVEGPHAVNTVDWFHVAVSYDGRPGVPGALQLFWTRLDEDRDAANRIGSGLLSRNLRAIEGDFAIGNEARSQSAVNTEAEPFPGLIDEVRISSVARHPT